MTHIRNKEIASSKIDEGDGRVWEEWYRRYQVPVRRVYDDTLLNYDPRVPRYDPKDTRHDLRE